MSMCRILVVFAFIFLKGGGSDKVLISADKTVWMADTDRREVTLVMNTTSPVYSLDYHFTKGYLYYTNDGSIVRRSLDFDSIGETPVTVVAYQNGAFVNSIAVDWVYNTLYWTTGSAMGVFTSDLNGSRSMAILTANDIAKLLSSKFTYLDNIQVDPFEKVLFMVSENKPAGTMKKVLLRTDTYGKDLTLIHTFKATEAYSTSIDVHKKKIYLSGTVTPPNKGILYAFDYNGTYTQILGGTAEIIFPIQVFLEGMYMMVHSTGHATKPVFCKVDVELKPTVTSCKSQQLLDSSDIPDLIYGLRVYDENTQMSPKRAGVHQCERKGCSYACMVVPTGGPTCVCSTGMQIDADGKTCREDEGVQLLVSGSGRIEKISVSTNSSSVLMKKEAVFVDFNFFKKSLFVVILKNEKYHLQWFSYTPSDDLRRSIPEDTWDIPDEVLTMGVDWSHDSVYISTRTANDAISKIWLVKLNRNRWTPENIDIRVLLNSYEHGIDNVKTLLVDPYDKLIFMMMVNSDGFGVILKSNLQGEGLVKLQRPHENITAMAIDIKQKMVYFVSNTNATYITWCNYEFTDEAFSRLIDWPNVMRMSVYSGSIFLATKKSNDDNITTFYHGTVIRNNQLITRHIITERIDLTDMRVYLPQTQLYSDDQTCLEMGCSHVCEVVPPSPLTNYQSLACACPENMRLDKKGMSCTDTLKPEDEPTVSADSIKLFLLLVVLAVVATFSVVVGLFCLWKRYGVTIGRDRFEYRENWWRRETAQDQGVTLQLGRK